MKDLYGRPWANVEQVKTGSKVQVDGDFSCIKEGEVLEVRGETPNYYIECSEGKHFLDGQLSDDATHYVGLYYVG